VVGGGVWRGAVQVVDPLGAEVLAGWGAVAVEAGFGAAGVTTARPFVG
jgi:hypothetical protein